MARFRLTSETRQPARSTLLAAAVAAGASGRHERPVDGVYRAGSDHRKDGQAVGW